MENYTRFLRLEGGCALNGKRKLLGGLICCLFIFASEQAYADGSDTSKGLYHWLEGNKCYKAKAWNCVINSWSTAFSYSDFIRWQETGHTFKGMVGLSQAVIFSSKKCRNPNSVAKINAAKTILMSTSEILSSQLRSRPAPHSITSYFLPSLSMCKAIICKSQGNFECVRNELALLDANSLKNDDYFGILPKEILTSRDVIELIGQRGKEN